METHDDAMCSSKIMNANIKVEHSLAEDVTLG